MATQDNVRRIASGLPGAVEGEERFGYSVIVKGKAKGFCWSWAERVHPKKARVINDSVLAIRVPNLNAKDLILGSSPLWAVDDPHYNGYPAVIVRLSEISVVELEDLLVEAWKSLATKELLAQLGQVESAE
jgi:hypothetical protein